MIAPQPTRNEVHRNEVDWSFLAWVFAWSFAFTVSIAALPPVAEEIGNDEWPLLFALVMGGFSATTIAAATWSLLIDLPRETQSPAGETVTRQQRQPRVLVLSLLATNLAVFMVLAGENVHTVAQTLVTVTTAVTSSIIVSQWTQQRIIRGSVPRHRPQRSIRQTLGIATTFAVGIAVIQLTRRVFGLPDSTVILAFTSGLLWVALIALVLANWWWMIFITVPVVSLQWITVSLWIEVQGGDLMVRIMQMSGAIVGFYLFSLLFLILMRSSGHRWPILRFGN